AVLRQGREHLLEVLAEVVLRGEILVRDAVGEHRRSVRRLPAEERARQILLLRLRAQEDVGVAAALREDLRQRAVVAERVDVRARRRGDAERLAQVVLPVERLAHERLAGGDVAVGLDPPAADHLEAAARDVRADPREELRIALVDPGEEERRVAREDVVRVLVEAVDRRLERRAHLLVALRPLPQPDRIDVRIADHVHYAGTRSSAGKAGASALVRLRRAYAAQMSTPSRMRCRRRTCISWIRAVVSDGTASAMSAWSAAGAPPPKKIVVAPSSRAAARPRTTFGDRPLVEKPTTTSPLRTKPRTWRSNTSS